MMLKLGIIGYPLKHTVSPAMHIAALQQLNIQGEYKAYEVKEKDLEELFNELRESDLRGFNVTIPHKIIMIPLLDKLSMKAELAGSVNTVTFEPNGVAIGDNTDITGFWDGLPENYKEKVKGKNASIIGYGGSAKAVCIALLQNNFQLITIYGRNKAKLERFKNFLLDRKEKLSAKTEIKIEHIKNISLCDTNLLVNTTPIGMYPNINESPLSANELKQLPKDSVVYDIIYNPTETKLLKDAKTLKLITINGLEMLVRQGAASLSLWLGEEVSPLNAMRTAAEESLEQYSNVVT